MCGSGQSKGKGQVQSFSLFYSRRGPKSEWVRPAISYALLSVPNFPYHFTFWVSRAGPRNGFQQRNSYFSFPHPSATSILPTGRKATSAWNQLPFQIYLFLSCLPEAAVALNTRRQQGEGPLSYHLKRWRRSSTCRPAPTPPRKGTAFLSGCLIKTLRLYNCKWRTQERKFQSDTEQSRTPCKQQWGMCGHNALSRQSCPHPSLLGSYRAREVFASVPPTTFTPLLWLVCVATKHRVWGRHKTFTISSYLKLIWLMFVASTY